MGALHKSYYTELVVLNREHQRLNVFLYIEVRNDQGFSFTFLPQILINHFSQ